MPLPLTRRRPVTSALTSALTSARVLPSADSTGCDYVRCRYRSCAALIPVDLTSSAAAVPPVCPGCGRR